MCDNGTAATAYCLCSPASPRDAPARRAGLSSHIVLSFMCDNGTAATAYCLCSLAPLRDDLARRADLSVV